MTSQHSIHLYIILLTNEGPRSHWFHQKKGPIGRVFIKLYNSLYVLTNEGPTSLWLHQQTDDKGRMYCIKLCYSLYVLLQLPTTWYSSQLFLNLGQGTWFTPSDLWCWQRVTGSSPAVPWTCLRSGTWWRPGFSTCAQRWGQHSFQPVEVTFIMRLRCTPKGQKVIRL